MQDHSHFQKILKTNIVVAQVDDPRIIRPIIHQMIVQHFNGNPKALSEWYHHFYIKHELHGDAKIPQNIVGSQFTTAGKLLKLYQLQLRAIQKALRQPSVPAALRYAKEYLNNVPIPYNSASKKIDVYRCALNAKNSYDDLIEMLPSDWCLGNNKGATLVSLCDVWLIKILLECHVNSIRTGMVLLTHYTETHTDEILKDYGPYADFHK